MKLLSMAFVWLLTKTCTGHRGGGEFGPKMAFWGQFSPWKFEFCWVNISESSLTVKKSVYVIAKIILPLNKNVINFSRGHPWRPLFIVIYKGRKRFLTRLKKEIFEHIVFSLALQYRSKSKQDVIFHPLWTISCLKIRGHSIHFACQSNENVSLSQIVNFRNFCSLLSFF